MLLRSFDQTPQSQRTDRWTITLYNVVWLTSIFKSVVKFGAELSHCRHSGIFWIFLRIAACWWKNKWIAFLPCQFYFTVLLEKLIKNNTQNTNFLQMRKKGKFILLHIFYFMLNNYLANFTTSILNILYLWSFFLFLISTTKKSK